MLVGLDPGFTRVLVPVALDFIAHFFDALLALRLRGCRDAKAEGNCETGRSNDILHLELFPLPLKRD